jgi:mannose-1-phosphate guanylyltransferase/mannose-1-phosphate guanylyltransferase/phosphomannomutase
MKAMVLAAGLGTRLRPLTYELPKPLVPVADRPIMELILELLRGHGVTEIAANLSYRPDEIREHFGAGSGHGVSIEWSLEEELLGTAGGVRNVRDSFGDERFLVMAADALTDIDLTRLREAHEANDGIATLAVKRVPDTSEYGVVVSGADGRIQGFQEKPDPAEALSDLASCMIYVLEPAIFDYFPDQTVVDFALDVFPELLANDVPFYVHEIDAYWNDVGSLDEYRQGNFDAISGAVRVDLGASEASEGILLGEGTTLPDEAEAVAPVLVGAGCEVGAGTRLEGPLVIGGGCRIGPGAVLSESVLLPGSEVPPDSILVGAIAGRRGTSIVSPDEELAEIDRSTQAASEEAREEQDDAGAQRLTPREREVMSLLALGLNGAEIAERLVLSPETVRVHVRNARQRLGARTRAHAIALALKRGEITLAER